MMRKPLFILLFFYSFIFSSSAASRYDNPDTIVVARDGTGEFRTVGEAIEVCRAFMDYHKVIYVKRGTYKEKLIIPQWLQNIEICGEDRDQTVITYDDHANIKALQAPLLSPEGDIKASPMGGGSSQSEAAEPSVEGWGGQKASPMGGGLEGASSPQIIGTFRTYTVKVEGNAITFKNITIENNAPRLGQAVALHTEGDRLVFVNCRFLGNQDTVYTGMEATRLYFRDCYIEGTTDFIFGPSTAWFERCHIHCKANSYITAASTPKNIMYGYIFNKCTITCAPEVTQVYLGRPWRDYGYTLFMYCSLPAQIRPEGWHHWEKQREQTARYFEYGNTGEGAATSRRVGWSRQLTPQEAQQITLERVFRRSDSWDVE